MNFCDNQSRAGRQQRSICLNIDGRQRNISSQICVWQCRFERRQDGFQPPFLFEKESRSYIFLYVTAVKVWKSKVPKCYNKMNAWLMPKILQGYDQKKLYRNQRGDVFHRGCPWKSVENSRFYAKKGDYYMWFNNQRKNKKNLEICRKTTTYCEWYRRYIQYFVLCERKYTNFSDIKILQNSCRNPFSTDFFTDCSFLWRSVA